MPLHPLSNFQIQIYYQIELKIKSAYARNNSPEISDGAYVKNLDECKLIGTHSITLNDDNVPYFDSSGVEDIQKGIKEFIGKKNHIKHL